MQLSAFATAAWLIWLAFIASKISVGLSPESAKQISKDCGRALIIIAGTYVARVASENCPDSVNLASAWLSGVAIVATVVDAVWHKNKAKRVMRPGSTAVLSAAIITVVEALLRAPRRCNEVVAPTLVAAVLLSGALSKSG